MVLKFVLSAVTFVFCFNSFAFSYIHCTSNKSVTYTYDNYTGGAYPPRGSVLAKEEIKVKGEIVYRKVQRTECYDEDCSISQPGMTDIIPENFSFKFLQETRKMLSSETPPSNPVHMEEYAIKFHLDKDIWMLCESYHALVP